MRTGSGKEASHVEVRAATAQNTGVHYDVSPDFGSPIKTHSLSRRLVRGVIHFLSYHFILRWRWTRVTTAAGFRLVVPPTVFHPRIFLTSEFFASYINRLNLRGQRVADVGTGTGILALAAARAGATDVVAIDINPNAAGATRENARRNGLNGAVTVVCSNLFSGIAPRPLFDVIISSPPSFSGVPIDLADRAWHSGLYNRDIAQLFDQAGERLLPGGRMYVLLSSDSDLAQMGSLIDRANFSARIVAKRSILIESFMLFELQKH